MKETHQGFLSRSIKPAYGRCFPKESVSSKQKSPTFVEDFLFGAGYGSRTRLRGLGSRCTTDVRILHCNYHSIFRVILQPFFVTQGALGAP